MWQRSSVERERQQKEKGEKDRKEVVHPLLFLFLEGSHW
jgi:hypothetical protein